MEQVHQDKITPKAKSGSEIAKSQANAIPLKKDANLQEKTSNQLTAWDLQKAHGVMEILEKADFKGFHKWVAVAFLKNPDDSGNGKLIYIRKDGSENAEDAKIVTHDGKNFVEFQRIQVSSGGSFDDGYYDETEIKDSIPLALNGEILGDSKLDPSSFSQELRKWIVERKIEQSKIELERKKEAERMTKQEAERQKSIERNMVNRRAVAKELWLFEAGNERFSNVISDDFYTITLEQKWRDGNGVITIHDDTRKQDFFRVELTDGMKPKDVSKRVNQAVKEFNLLNRMTNFMSRGLQKDFPWVDLFADYAWNSTILRASGRNTHPAMYDFKLVLGRENGTSWLEKSSAFLNYVNWAIKEHVSRFEQRNIEQQARRREFEGRRAQEVAKTREAEWYANEAEVMLRRAVESYNRDNPQRKMEVYMDKRGGKMSFGIPWVGEVGSVTFGSWYTPSMHNYPSILNNTRYLHANELRNILDKLYAAGGRKR